MSRRETVYVHRLRSPPRVSSDAGRDSSAARSSDRSSDTGTAVPCCECFSRAVASLTILKTSVHNICIDRVVLLCESVSVLLGLHCGETLCRSRSKYSGLVPAGPQGSGVRAAHEAHQGRAGSPLQQEGTGSGRRTPAKRAAVFGKTAAVLGVLGERGACGAWGAEVAKVL